MSNETEGGISETAHNASSQDAVLQVLYGNFGCFALLTAHTLKIPGPVDSSSFTDLLARALGASGMERLLAITIDAAVRWRLPCYRSLAAPRASFGLAS
jgi:hypothetical protein